MSLQAPATKAEAGRPAGAGQVSRHAHQGLALLLILAASFMVVLDFSIVNVALPDIEREFGFTASSVQWVVTAYAITFGGFLILGGRAADLFGRRRIFTIGLVLFALASLAGGLAGDPLLLVVSRFAQGIGAAMVASSSLSLITTSFDEGQERTRALGLYGATASVGFVAGQVLGGLLVQYTSWRLVFLVNVPIGLLAAGLAPVLLPAAGRMVGRGRSLDLWGAVSITVSVAAVVYAVSQSAAHGWTVPVVLAALALAVAAGAAFILVERRHPDPLVRLSLLRLPSLRSANTMSLLLGAWNAGEMLVLSLYYQQVLGAGPLMTGLAIAPQGVVGFLAGAYGARMTSRIGVRGVLVLTSATGMIGFAILTQLPAAGYSPLLLAVTLVGFGTAGIAFGTVVQASNGIADADQGVVGGLVNTTRQVGAALGAALMPAIVETVSAGSGSAVGGDRAAMLAGAIAAGLALVVAARNRGAGGKLLTAQVVAD
ncbi:MAG: MFS transporter [Streptosporangiaceae bacterium]